MELTDGVAVGACRGEMKLVIGDDAGVGKQLGHLADAADVFGAVFGARSRGSCSGRGGCCRRRGGRRGCRAAGGPAQSATATVLLPAAGETGHPERGALLAEILLARSSRVTSPSCQVMFVATCSAIRTRSFSLMRFGVLDRASVDSGAVRSRFGGRPGLMRTSATSGRLNSAGGRSPFSRSARTFVPDRKI